MPGPWEKFSKPSSAMFNDPYKDRTANREDQQLGLSAAQVAISQRRLAMDAEQQTAGSLPTGYRWADGSHTKQEIIPGGPADTSTDSATGGQSEEATVKALVDGRMAFPAGAALRSTYWQNMLAKVAKADPNFDAINYNARAATRKDFTSGVSARNITAFNTALGHLGTLYETSKGLNNGNLTPWNYLGNKVNKTFGDPAVDKFNTAAHAAVDELEKAFRGSGGTQAGIEEWKQSLNSSQSPAQTRAVIGQMVDLLGSRINAMGEQYKAGMGRSIDGITLLDPHAQAVFNALGPNGTGKIDKEPPNNNPLMGGSGKFTPPDSGGGGGAASNQPGLSPSGGGDSTFYTERDQALADEAQKAFVDGASKDQINAIAAKYGRTPFGPELDKALAGRGQNLGVQFTPTPTGHREAGLTSGLANALPGGVGSFAAGVGNAATFGQLGNIAKATGGSEGGTDVAMRMARSNGLPYFAGSAVGDVGGLLLGGAGLAKAAGSVASPTIASLLANPLTADVAYGAAQGAGNAEDPLYGAVGGALLAGAGTLGGKAAGQYISGMRNPSGVSRLNPGEQMLMGAVDKTGRDFVVDALSRARDLNVPAGLADVSPEVNSLTGAAIRRSPTAAGMARDTLIPRGRGQYDRMVKALSTDLGPIENIPQRSEDLIKAAKQRAGPLYDEAFAAPGAGAIYDQVAPLLQRPSMQKALGNANKLAQEEGRDPTSLGFDLDAQGNTVLQRVPSWETLHTTKVGLDDVVQANKTANMGSVDNEGRLINNTLQDFLGIIDNANPAYKTARQAYAGPIQERQFLEAGQQAVNASPDQLAVDVAGLTPERQGQMQLGFQSQIAENAGKLRYSTNPFESVLGTPAMEQRLSTLYPQSEGVGNLLARRDLETQLAASSNRLTGNSMTAERGLADEAFGANPLVEAGLHAGAAVATHGASLPGTAARLAGITLKDRVALGLRRGAEERADQIAPIALDIDPASAITRLDDLTQRQKEFQIAKALLAAQGARPGSIAGTSGVAALLSTYGDR